MPRSHTMCALLQTGSLVLAECAAAQSQQLLQAVDKAGPSFSSLAGRSLMTRGTSTQNLGTSTQTRCSCGFCNGHNSIPCAGCRPITLKQKTVHEWLPLSTSVINGRFTVHVFVLVLSHVAGHLVLSCGFRQGNKPVDASAVVCNWW